MSHYLAIKCAPLTKRGRRRPLTHDEVPEQHGQRIRLHRFRVDGQEVIAEEALLRVTDQVGPQHLLPALRAGHRERHGRRVPWCESPTVRLLAWVSRGRSRAPSHAMPL